MRAGARCRRPRGSPGAGAAQDVRANDTSGRIETYRPPDGATSWTGHEKQFAFFPRGGQGRGARHSWTKPSRGETTLPRTTMLATQRGEKVLLANRYRIRRVAMAAALGGLVLAHPGAANAQRGSGIQLSPQSNRYFISKDVGPER